MPRKSKSTKAWTKYPKSIEKNYWRSIRPVNDRIRKEYKKTIEPEISSLLGNEIVAVPDYSMDDAVSEKIGKLFRQFRVNYYGQWYPVDGDPKTISFRNKVENQVSKDAKAISRFHKTRYDTNQKFVLGVDPLKSEPWLKGYLQDWTAQNVSLIKDIPDFAIDTLEQTVTRSVLNGDSMTFLKSQIGKVLNDSERRLRLIARDQSNKLYGTLTEVRANFNGWDFYEWDDSNDIRVRTDHRRLDGKIFKFSEPPITVTTGKRAGERNNPGQDIQCRCVALILFDRDKFLLLRKQPDGSYSLPKTLAA